MTRSLLAQLMDQCQNLPTTLRTEYDSWSNCGRKNRPSDTRFLKLLGECISEFPRVFVVLDAFDETDFDERPGLIESLQKLCGSKLNLFITTRSPLAAQLQAKFPQSVELEITAQDDDISKYLKDRLKGNFLRDKLKEYISERLLRGAQGKYVSPSHFALMDLGFDSSSFSWNTSFGKVVPRI
jgi:hypothetical protein